MAIGNYDFQKIEKETLEFWEKNNIYKKLVARNKSGQKFYFLQGPPYTSGKLHVGHAWNSSLKDMALRFRRMTGFNVWDRAGYDMHGLPTEKYVQKLHNLKTKDEIKIFGEEKFAQECKERSTELAKEMDKDLWRMGVWLNYQDPYYPVSNEFIEGQWWLIKKAHQNGRLYEGFRTVTWCWSCETACAKHELQYEEITEDSIFVKLQIKDKPNEFLIIWTTTPWTIPFNLGVMVHPELDYVKADVDGEKWIVAKGLAAPVIQVVANKQLKIEEEFKGKQLEGVEYIHPFYNILKETYDNIKKDSAKAFTIVLSDEYVNLSAGTGLVHMAPGCGPEDYEVGHRNGIPPFNFLHENGNYPEEAGEFAGLNAKKDNHKFIEALEKAGALIEVTKVKHDYAHCERCRNPIIYRATKQWFFKIEDLIPKLLEANKDTHWVPRQAGEWYDQWIAGLRDNSITKQRFWGTPLPVWKCEECEEIEVVGSKDELEELGATLPESLHKPWIDDIKLTCKKCKNEMNRIPDVIDVWVDAGTTSWNCLYFPKREDLLKEFFPADLVLEAKEQVRLWFYMLNLCSALGFDEASAFKNVYLTGMLNGIGGVKMSKSLGNIISPYELIDKHGTDTMRLYLCSINAATNMAFSWEEIALKNRTLGVLWNTHKYLIEMSNKVKPKKTNTLGIEEKYILSKLHSTLKKVTEHNEKYELDNIPPLIEELYLEVSRTYIQLVRGKVNSDDPDERNTVLYTLYECLINICKMFSPVCPFITDAIFQNFKQEFNLEEESIHLTEWPEFDQKLINEELEEEMLHIQEIIRSALAAREKSKIGRRWPLSNLTIVPKKVEIERAVDNLKNILKQQINVKEVVWKKELEGAIRKLKPDYAKLKPAFGDDAVTVIAHLSTTPNESLLTHFDKENQYTFKVNGKELTVKPEHFIEEIEAPSGYIMNEFRGGVLYLRTEMDMELETEGYTRELMRKIQDARKKLGLEKLDKIKLQINIPEELENIKNFEEEIRNKCGAHQLFIETDKPEQFENNQTFKIKDKEFKISYKKE